MAKKKEESFEEALAELETIVNEMENSEPALTELTKKYSRGILLSQKCLQELDEAEKAMDLIVKETTEGVYEESMALNKNSDGKNAEKII